MIKVQQIGKPVKVKVNILIYIIVILLALTIVGALIALPILLVSAAIAKRRAEKKAKIYIEKDFLEFIGAKPQYINTSLIEVPGLNSSIVGNGIAYHQGCLYILDKGVAAQIPWDDIRSYSWHIEGYNKTEMYGGGIRDMGTKMQVGMDNAFAAMKAERASGMFIEVADIDRPVWHFQTADKALLNRWMEIFNQIKEGKIS